MPKLNLEQFIQEEYDRGLMTEMVRQIEDAINRLSEGRIYQHYNALGAAPSGPAQLGDKIWNTSPTPMGSPEYVVIGWVCTASGDPAVFAEMRVLTGG